MGISCVNSRATIEMCADKYQITREEQDEYAIRSYKLAQEAI